MRFLPPFLCVDMRVFLTCLCLRFILRGCICLVFAVAYAVLWWVDEKKPDCIESGNYVSLC